MENLTELLKGVLEGCVLELISRGETYGYEITRSLNALGFTDIVEGTVYTILLRLEKHNLVQIEKRPSDKGPARKFYTLSDAGRLELERIWARWDFVTEKIHELKEMPNHARTAEKTHWGEEGIPTDDGPGQSPAGGLPISLR